MTTKYISARRTQRTRKTRRSFPRGISQIARVTRLPLNFESGRYWLNPRPGRARNSAGLTAGTTFADLSRCLNISLRAAAAAAAAAAATAASDVARG